MAEPVMGTPTEEMLEALFNEARWFAGKGRPFTIESVQSLGVLGDSPDLELLLVNVTYSDGDREQYQVPLAWYGSPEPRLEHALVGTVDGRSCYDAVHDRDAMAHYLRAFIDASQIGELSFQRLPGNELPADAPSALFSGEQSNSSIMFGDAALFKMFRKLTPGVNPDVSIHRVLTEAESDHVAALYGWLESGDLHLGMLQQYLRTASDGWDLALASVRNLFAENEAVEDGVQPAEVGGDFAAEAARLGAALAEIHLNLAASFDTSRRNRDDLVALSEQMIERLDAAIEVVPALAAYVDLLRTAYQRVAAIEPDSVQQIHGDLHLGQTLRTAKGWKFVDFEGEPAKPLAERTRPDSVWRDVAGMMRSFSYAARVPVQTLREFDGAEHRETLANQWSARNREALITAYAGRELTADEQILLDAYIADKAVYEVVYEARNRPTWVDIPLEAIARIGAAS